MGQKISATQARIAPPPPESEDAGAWLRHAVALLQTIEPGPGSGKQQQQAALAFLQASKVGAQDAEVRSAQLEAVVGNLRSVLDLVGLKADRNS